METYNSGTVLPYLLSRQKSSETSRKRIVLAARHPIDAREIMHAACTEITP
jgi:hypothetical protein